jgi:glutaredoxin
MGQEMTGAGRARRCERHGLATGPDGLCTLCRRESSPAPPLYGRWVIGGILLSTMLVTAGTLVYRLLTRDSVVAEAEIVTASERPVATSESVEAPQSTTEPAARKGESLPLEDPVPAPAVPVLESPSLATAAASPKQPSEAEVRAALAATPIVIYATTWCGVCGRARQFLKDNGLRYQEIDADQSPGGWEKVAALAGKRAVPVIVVDGVVIQGLSPQRVMDAVARSMERRLGVKGIRFQSK